MATLILLQMVLPLGVLALLAAATLRSWAGRLIQTLAAFTTLLAVHLAGLWLMPPWWTAWVYWLLFAVALYRAGRKPPVTRLPESWLGWAALLACLALAAYTGWTAVQAWLGRQAPPGRIVELRFPLSEGHYLVVNGGTNTSVSSHALTLARATPRQRQYYGQSHAVDVVAIDGFGLPADGFNPEDPSRYAIFGHTVRAPCDGLVMQVAGDKPDMPVPVMDSRNMAGNHVLLRCESADILLAHLRRGSVNVASGAEVRAGEILGDVGNSGNTSVPHLHIHAQEPGTTQEPFSGRPLPMLFNGRYLVRGDRL